MLRHTSSEESGSTSYIDSYRHGYETQNEQRPDQHSYQDHARYDAATACEVVERAAQLQAEAEAHSLTAADIEAMARQSGVDPRYVRQTLAQMREANSLHSISSTEPTERERRLMTTYPLVYGAFVFTQMAWLIKSGPSYHQERILLPILIMVLPGLMAFYLGGRLGKTRWGMRAGLSVAVATCSAAMLALAFFVSRSLQFGNGEYAVAAAILFGGTMLGALGAETTKVLRKPFARWKEQWRREA